MVSTISTLKDFNRLLLDSEKIPVCRFHVIIILLLWKRRNVNKTYSNTEFNVTFFSLCGLVVDVLQPKFWSIRHRGVRPSKISASLLNSDVLRMMEDLELFQLVKFLLQLYSSGSNEGHGPYIVGVVRDPYWRWLQWGWWRCISYNSQI